MAVKGNTLIRSAIMKSREVRVQPYWDRQDLDVTVDVSFFTTARTGTAAGNLPIAGQFAAPRQFLVQGIGFHVPVNTVAADLILIAANIVITLFIADKEYLRLPVWMAPQGGGFQSALTTSNGNGHPLAYNYFKVKPTILIPMQQNFRVVASGCVDLSASTLCTVALYGTEERAVQ